MATRTRINETIEELSVMNLSEVVVQCMQLKGPLTVDEIFSTLHNEMGVRCNMEELQDAINAVDILGMKLEVILQPHIIYDRPVGTLVKLYLP